MKKILLSIFALVAIGFASRVEAQCTGANVTLFNITVTNPATGTFEWSYNWKYNQGNASILAVLTCGGVEVATSVCNPNLAGQADHNTSFVGFASGTLVLPDPTCPGVREIEFRIYSSSNCNGTYCGVPQTIILPVNFGSFTATRNRSAVSLQWETLSEENNSGFALERNTGTGWFEFAFIPSLSQNGTSADRLTYSYSDMNDFKGISQYRIRQVDLDGKARYSLIRAVRGNGQKASTIVYPNPSSDGKVKVVFEDMDATRDVSLIDMSGRIVRQWKGVTTNNIQIENLSPGIFSLRIVVAATGEQSVEKIVVNKR